MVSEYALYDIVPASFPCEGNVPPCMTNRFLFSPQVYASFSGLRAFLPHMTNCASALQLQIQHLPACSMTEPHGNRIGDIVIISSDTGNTGNH